MPYSLPETGTRKIRYQIACQTRQKPVPVLWYWFSVPISGTCVIGIRVGCAMLTVPPRFTKELAEKTLTLPVGSSTAVEVPFAASPQPKVTWTFNGGKLPDPKRFKTDTISAMTSLTMAKLVRKDAGKYAVTVENELGKCELAVTVVVLGKTTLSTSLQLF